MALIVLDTDVSSLIIKDKLPGQMATQLVGHKLALTYVTVAELTQWVALRQWGPHRRARLAEFRQGKHIIIGDEDVAEVWGQLSATATQDGHPCPVNDSWIAACCLAYGLPLATLNLKDFAYYEQCHGLHLLTTRGPQGN
jgi:predicted nucleic acid-binding protein